MPLLYIYLLVVLSFLLASSNKAVDHRSRRKLVNLNGRPVEDLRPLNQVRMDELLTFRNKSLWCLCKIIILRGITISVRFHSKFIYTQYRNISRPCALKKKPEPTKLSTFARDVYTNSFHWSLLLQVSMIDCSNFVKIGFVVTFRYFIWS